MSRVEVFFDYTCPFSHRGIGYLEQLLPHYPNVELIWHPIEAHPKNEEPEKRPWVNLAVQTALCVRDLDVPQLLFHNRMYEAYFDENLDIEDIEVLATIAHEVGADKTVVLEALQSGKYEQAGLEANDYAYEQKEVWALPTFVAQTVRLDSKPGVGVTKEQVRELLEKSK